MDREMRGTKGKEGDKYYEKTSKHTLMYAFMYCTCLCVCVCEKKTGALIQTLAVPYIFNGV